MNTKSGHLSDVSKEVFSYIQGLLDQTKDCVEALCLENIVFFKFIFQVWLGYVSLTFSSFIGSFSQDVFHIFQIMYFNA